MNLMRDYTQQRLYRVFRKDISRDISLPEGNNLSYVRKGACYFKSMCELEEPIVFPDERIAFTRTDSINTKELYEKYAGREAESDYQVYIPINNTCPDYSILMNEGLAGLRRRVKRELDQNPDSKGRDFLESCEIVMDAVEGFVARYSEEAEKVGNTEVALRLKRVPHNPPTSMLDALQSLRFISSMFHLAGNYQLGFGRMDQYLYPFYCIERKRGVTDDVILEYIKEFFVSLNRDSDLYYGMQQGDNGQSIMLGGVNKDGVSAINELTYIIMKASKELRLIDPKINLRIDKNTPDELLTLGCELTKEGLGFPQYSNDEVVIPALEKAGYSLDDARDYTVAACWEYIIPGYGLEIVNQGAVSFPYAVDYALDHIDVNNATQDQFEALIKKNITDQVRDIIQKRDIRFLPSALVSLFFHGPIEKHRDITECARYANKGIHGAGSSNAADAALIVKRLLNSDRELLKRYIDAKKANYAGFFEELQSLKYDYPKVGNADMEADEWLTKLFDWFADSCAAFSTAKCNIRPGSGSSQFYVWLTAEWADFVLEPKVKATIDGRKNGEYFASSLAPSQGVKVSGLYSVLKSFSMIDYSKIMNGGPITVEFSPSVFATGEGIEKLKGVIRYFVEIGDQQLQLNVLDEKTLEDAMKHPERHRNLIVRVWGWSGYFCELAPDYQRHIINRHKYGL